MNKVEQKSLRSKTICYMTHIRFRHVCICIRFKALPIQAFMMSEWKREFNKKKKRENLSQSICPYEWKKKKVCVGEHNTIWLWMVTNNKSQWTKNRNASKPNIYRVKINIRWRIQAIMNYDFLYSFFFHSFSVCVLIFILPLHFRQKEKKRLKLNSAGKSRSCYVHRMKWNKMIRMNYHLVWSHSKRMSHWYTFGTILMKGISIYVDAIFFFIICNDTIM